jgi:cellobiose transport system substrate-binding protein
MARIPRRSFLAGAAGLSAAALAGGLSGCGSQTSISSDPSELVLWYWDRSISRELLGQAAQQIPGTDKHLRADIIGGTFDQKLRTSLAGNAYIPDITAINSNVALYFPNEDMFFDLNEFGAAEAEDEFFEWKWQLGVTPTNRFCFWPMDSGPTGFYYRQDIFAEANLPTEPEDVGEAIKTWEGFIELGQKLRKNADAFTMITGAKIFQQYVNASAERYFDKEGNPLYMDEGSAVRQAWDTAVAAIDAGICGNQQNETDQNAAWSSGKTAGQIEAVWWAEILMDTAPDTEGNWRIAQQPVRAGNSGGSFLCLPKTSKDPQAGYEFMRWLTTPENQALAFNELRLFPSTHDAFTGGKMQSTGKFFGDQDYADVFLTAAEQVPTAFISTYETQAAYFDSEMINVESAGKDPDRAWDDAVEQTNRTLAKRGVEV